MTVSPLAPAAFPAMPKIKGVSLSTAASGMKYTGRDDMLLMRLEGSGSIAAVFTKSKTAAAPVQWCRQQLGAGGGARAILVNAGNANAFTGDDGMAAVTACCEGVAAKLGCAAGEVLTASTGVIGEPLDSAVLAARFDDLASGSADWQAAAQAILTTDTFGKGASATAAIAGTDVQIAGIAKGSGMIAPDMATMLGFIATDAALPQPVLAALLADATDRSFNAITVDGDTSTNDTVLAFAAGPPLAKEHHAVLEQGLTQAMQLLAQAIARDGEGATCLIEVQVEGAVDEAAALRVARTVCGSSLVKTAVHGRDPNWGRIVAAAGRSGVSFEPDAVALWIGPHQLMAAGQPLAFDRPAASDVLRQEHVPIRLSLGNGSGSGQAWGCDLSDQYVRINADYTT